MNTNGNTQVQYITYVSDIKQNVFMAVTIDVNGVFLKMVSEDSHCRAHSNVANVRVTSAVCNR